MLYPVSLLLFLMIFPELKNIQVKRLHRAIIFFFGYVLLQGLVIFPFTEGFKYFSVIFLKHAQYFIVFYLLLYTFQFHDFKERTIRIISILVGANILWALIQIILGHRAVYAKQMGELRKAYGIGAFCETFPHQAAAIFLFCFLFSFFCTKIKFRKLLMFFSAAAIVMTVSRITIIALLACLLYIIATNDRFKTLIKKPLVIISFALAIFVAGIALNSIFVSMDSSAYNLLTRRFSAQGFSRGINKRLTLWDSYFPENNHKAYMPATFLTGRGRGYFNIANDSWRLSADSGYIRDFIEIGIIGLFLHYLVFFRAGKYIGFRKYWVLLLPYLILSITYEVFLVSKSGLIILILTAILLSEECRYNKDASKCSIITG